MPLPYTNAPCQATKDGCFRVAVGLPRGTNFDMEPVETVDPVEDKFLFAVNKWLLAHPDSPDAKKGACVGLTGTNHDIYNDLP